MATKRIKFIKPWAMVPAGAEMEFDVPVADLLILKGRAKAVDAPAPVKETQTPAAARKQKRGLRIGGKR